MVGSIDFVEDASADVDGSSRPYPWSRCKVVVVSTIRGLSRTRNEISPVRKIPIKGIFHFL